MVENKQINVWAKMVKQEWYKRLHPHEGMFSEPIQRAFVAEEVLRIMRTVCLTPEGQAIPTDVFVKVYNQSLDMLHLL